MRIHRDVRFSADKRPYKQHLGLVFWIGSGKKVELPCFYLHLAPERSFFYGGQHMFPKPVLERYRAAVDDRAAGTALMGILKDLQRQGLRPMKEPAYKRVPQGFARDHARADLLRYGGLGVAVDLPAGVLFAPELVAVCADLSAKARRLVNWLCTLNG